MENKSESIVSSEVEIIGTVKSKGSVRIDGKLDGELQVSGDAIVGKSATIKGNIHVNSVVVEGAVNGNIAAEDKIDMKQNARVTGDIRSKRLAVEDGVTFVGKSEVNPSGSASPPAPPLSGSPKSRSEDPPKHAEKAAVGARK